MSFEFDKEAKEALDRLVDGVQPSVEAYCNMSPADFESAPTKVRDRILFEMMVAQHQEVRDVARLARYAQDLLTRASDYAESLKNPDIRKKLMSEVMDSVLGGGMGGMFGGKF